MTERKPAAFMVREKINFLIKVFSNPDMILIRVKAKGFSSAAFIACLVKFWGEKAMLDFFSLGFLLKNKELHNFANQLSSQ